MIEEEIKIKMDDSVTRYFTRFTVVVVFIFISFLFYFLFVDLWEAPRLGPRMT